MYIPSIGGEDIPPVPISSIDVTRRARTRVGNADETAIGDVWCGGDVGARELSALWVGETVFASFSYHRRVLKLFACAS